MATKRGGGGQVKFYPYEKGGGGGGVSHAEWDWRHSVGVVFMQYLEVVAIMKGGCNIFRTFKRGNMIRCTLFQGGGGGGYNKFQTRYFVDPPPPRLPVIDQLTKC